MRIRVLSAVPESGHFTDAEMETFFLRLTCSECLKPIESATDAHVIFRADKAWNRDDTAPDVVHAGCRDALLRRRYRYEHLRLIRIKPLVELLAPLMESLGVYSSE